MPVKGILKKRKLEESIPQEEILKPQKNVKLHQSALETKKNKEKKYKIETFKKKLEENPFDDKNFESLLTEIDQLSLYGEELTNQIKEEENEEINLTKNKNEISKIKNPIEDLESSYNSILIENIGPKNYFVDNDEEKIYQVYSIETLNEDNENFGTTKDSEKDENLYFNHTKLIQKAFKGIRKLKKEKIIYAI